MKVFRVIFSRVTFMILMILAEVLTVFFLFRWLSSNAVWLETVLRILSVVVVLSIVKNSKHLSSDMLWILLIVLSPVAGTAIYFLLGANLITSKTFWKLTSSTVSSKRFYLQDEDVYNRALEECPRDMGQIHYVSKISGYPVYENTGFEYYSYGQYGYPEILSELRKAQKFIFLEYFIVEEGVMWNGILEILEEKVKAGVDVRVMYDDLGSFMTLSMKYAEKLEEKGIRCVPFNRINPVVGSIMNHRDHRKIMVIDGEVAFSGGINLADEYINAIRKVDGEWKDNVIKITGEAVYSYTAMFLTHWDALRGVEEDFTQFRAESPEGKKDGYILPYGETPLDQEITAQNIYVNILNDAQKYVYIFTPYLIIDTELTNALILCAKRGVDVRIMTPGVPDKKIVYSITRSYYRNLVEGGVKIYEYTPGFLHSKVFVSDDRIAAVGTVNLDYRSLYLHFENGTLLIESEKIRDIRRDFEDAVSRSHLVDYTECRYKPLKEFLLSVLRVLAPMM